MRSHPPLSTPAVGTIHHGDCLELLAGVEDDSVDLAFADPPFNIGFKYDRYEDNHDDAEYLSWCGLWMGELFRVLKSTGSFWLAIGDEFAADLRVQAHRELGFTPRNWVVWYYTFGQNCRRKFNRSHVHLFHFVKDEQRHTFNAADPLVRVPSARALVYGDRRANPTGRLPDDTWMLRPAGDRAATADGADWVLRPQDLRDRPDAFQSMDDTWYFSRVAGTFKERQGFHGCQMPEQLLGRIVRVSSDPGDLVLDPFSGSGTTLAVAKKLGRRWLGMDVSEGYAAYANARLAGCREGDPLDGPDDPVASSPTTAAGRQLKGHPLLPTLKPGDSTRPEPVPATAPAPAARARRAAGGSLRELQRAAIIDAFAQARDGHSIDWLLCDPAMQDRFHAGCREAGLLGRPGAWTRELLRLRKAGKLAPTPSERPPRKVDIEPRDTDRYAFAAEIAWANLAGEFPGVSLDGLFCSPGKSRLFDRMAARHLATPVAVAGVRWAALALRKARHALAVEAARYRFLFRDRDFQAFIPAARLQPRRLAGQPGVYLLRGRGQAPIYLGETLDLGARLQTHLAAPAPGAEMTHAAVIRSKELPSDDYRMALWRTLVGRYSPPLNAPVVDATRS